MRGGRIRPGRHGLRKFYDIRDGLFGVIGRFLGRICGVFGRIVGFIGGFLGDVVSDRGHGRTGHLGECVQ